MAKQTEKQIRESLEAQLRAKGAEVSHFLALIDDYCFYFKMIKKMKADISKKGMTYPAVSAQGKEYEKDNPNLKLLPQYTQRMLQILKDLKLTVDEPIEDDEDEL